MFSFSIWSMQDDWVGLASIREMKEFIVKNWHIAKELQTEESTLIHSFLYE